MFAVPAVAALAALALTAAVLAQAPQTKTLKPAGGSWFDALPANHAIQVGERTLTKAQFLGEYDKLKRDAGPLYRPRPLANLEASLKREHDARVSADNARIEQAWAKTARAGLPPAKPLATADPTIERLAELPPISPGEKFYILGHSFGERPGKVEFVFTAPPRRVSLPPIYWNPKGTALEVAVPSGLQGLVSQPVAVQITRTDDVRSNEVSTTFNPTTRAQSFSFRRSTETCSPSVAAAGAGGRDRDSNVCKDDEDSPLEAYHNWGLADLGVDIIKLPALINGYQYCASSAQHVCDARVWCRVDITGFVEGSAGPLTMSVPWYYTRPDASTQGMSYWLYVTVCGPEGVPYAATMSGG